MRAILFAAAGLVLGALPAMAEQLDFSNSEDDAVRAAEAAWASSIAEAREAGSSSSLRAIKRDLNGDGKPEVVGMLQSTYLCGGNAGCFFVLRDPGSGYDVIFSVPGAETVEVLDTKTMGWRDLKFNELNTWRFNGNGYSLQ
jgi:hypothetical protein